jgi:hypothetical protein
MVDIELPEPDKHHDKGVSPFTKRVGLTTAAFAVLLAISALVGGNNTKELLLAQQRASNQWAWYQAKSIRQHLYDSLSRMMELNLAQTGGTMAPEAKKRLADRLAKMKAEVKRFKAEKAKIMKDARAQEKLVALGQDRDPYLDYSQVFLQIAIILASIAMITASGRFFIMALVMAGGGCLLLVNGWLLFFRIPFLH